MSRNRVALVLALVGVSGCEQVGKVLTDFKQQPKVDPWETPADTIAPRANPQGSVPIYGSVAPGFAYGRSQTVATVDSMSRLTNPVAADERSLRNGGQQYAINCSVCHGALGAGDGPVTKFGYPPMPIGSGSNAATRLSDGPGTSDPFSPGRPVGTFGGLAGLVWMARR